MLSIKGSLERRRRRGQNEVNVLVREFNESGLSQKEFALKVVFLQTSGTVRTAVSPIVHPASKSRHLAPRPSRRARRLPSSGGRILDRKKEVPRYFQWEGGLDWWRMMAIDDTGTDLWTVAGAWEELEGGGVAV